MTRFLLVLVLLLPHWAQAEERLGRLFLTPGERSGLDYIRQTSKLPDRIVKPKTTESADGDAVAPPVPASRVTVQGYVKRSDGKGTVWINRQPLRETSTQGDIAVGRVGAADGRVPLKLTSTAKEISLKAGQTYDPASGAVVERARDLPDAPGPDITAPEAKPGQPAGLVHANPKKP